MILGLTLLVACSSGSDSGEFEATDEMVLVVFTTLKEPRLAEFLGAYGERMGLRLEMIHGDLQSFHDATIADGHSPDLFIAGNIRDLTQAARENVFRPIRSAVVFGRVPQVLRDPDQLWTALAVRERGVVFNPEFVSASEIDSIASFASLADESWRDRLCLSSSSLAGNRSLIARLMRDHGERETHNILRGWRDNLAQPVHADDAALLRAIADGVCAIGIADSGEVAHLVEISQHETVARHRFADVDRVHVELSGVGVSRHARNPETALALLEVLTETGANANLAAILNAYPANPQAPAAAHPDRRPPLGDVIAGELGYLLEDAVLLAERARYP